MKKKYTKKQIVEAITYWEKQLKNLDEAWGPKPITTSKHYSEGSFDFIVTVTSGKRRPRHGEGSQWVPFKSRRVTWANDPTGKFMGRLYNDFGNIVLEPDFDGYSEEWWANKVGFSKEKLHDFYVAAEEVLQRSKKDM